MSALITVFTLILTFWLITLVWNRKVARRLMQIILITITGIAILGGSYAAYQSYRWGTLLHQLNERSLRTTDVINNTTPVTLAARE